MAGGNLMSEFEYLKDLAKEIADEIIDRTLERNPMIIDNIKDLKEAIKDLDDNTPLAISVYNHTWYQTLDKYTHGALYANIELEENVQNPIEVLMLRV
jgi:hypothetical protein